MNKKNITWRMRIGTPPGGLRTIVPEEMQQFRSFTDQGTDHFVWRGHPEAGGNFEVEMTLSPGTHGLNAAAAATKESIRRSISTESAGIWIPGTGGTAAKRALWSTGMVSLIPVRSTFIRSTVLCGNAARRSRKIQLNTPGQK